MKKMNLMLGGAALLAGGVAYFLFTRKKEAVAELVTDHKSRHADGEKMLRHALHKAKGLAQ